MCTGENSSEPTRFTAESVLVEELEQAARTAAPERGVHRGRIVSGDQFISGAEKKKQLREAFNAVCAEMESAAIAQTCQYAGVPFGILRVSRICRRNGTGILRSVRAHQRRPVCGSDFGILENPPEAPGRIM